MVNLTDDFCATNNDLGDVWALNIELNVLKPLLLNIFNDIFFTKILSFVKNKNLAFLKYYKFQLK